MCNLYSITRSQEAVRRLFAVAQDLTGNLPPMPGVFPDMPAPVVRADGAERRLELMRWGMPGPPQFGGAPVTNIRNTKSPHWRRWLGPESRCLVPVNSFCEWADTKPKKTPTWFALDDARPLFAFAGIWTPWRGFRGLVRDGLGSPACRRYGRVLRGLDDAGDIDDARCDDQRRRRTCGTGSCG